jgi:CMP/dCMP kinase
MKINIAIDGPVGSGKSTLGREFAQKINYQFLDSGLFYRYFAKLLAENGYNSSEKEKVIEFCSQKKIVIARDPKLFFQQLENQQIILSQPEVSNLASLFSPIQELRQIIRELIRNLVKNKGFVVVGRDMTFKVLPEAEVKIFLTASQSKRVERRYQQLKENGKNLSLEEVKKDLIERDKRDEWNVVQAEKVGIKVDTSNLTSAESIEELYKLYWKKTQEFK